MPLATTLYQPGKRVRVTQQLPHRDQVWSSVVEGVITGHRQAKTDTGLTSLLPYMYRFQRLIAVRQLAVLLQEIHQFGDGSRLIDRLQRHDYGRLWEDVGDLHRAGAPPVADRLFYPTSGLNAKLTNTG